jgi:hypothetical protein
LLHYCKPHKQWGIPPDAVAEFHAANETFMDAPDCIKHGQRSIFERTKKKSPRPGRTMAGCFMREIGCLATRYVGCNRQVPIKIGAAMSFFDGTKTIVGRVAHYRTTEEGLQVTYERQWTKDDLLASDCEKTRQLGGMLRHDQILHSSEEETVSAEFITRAVSIVPRHLYSPGHMEGGKYELVGVIEPTRDITAPHKLYLIDEGTAEEQAASTAKEVKMGYYVVDYEDHVQVWCCSISCTVLCVCGPKCVLALTNSLSPALPEQLSPRFSPSPLPPSPLPLLPISLSPYLPLFILLSPDTLARHLQLLRCQERADRGGRSAAKLGPGAWRAPRLTFRLDLR